MSDTPAAELETALVLSRAGFAGLFPANLRYLPLGSLSGKAAEVLGRCRPAKRSASLEADDRVKQAVVYVTARARFGDITRFWLYKRPGVGGDGRLRSLYSLGVGGHVRLGDWGQDGFRSTGVLHAAARREYTEETGQFPFGLELRGIVNNENDHVGRCHLGFCYTADVDDPMKLAGVPGQGVEPIGWFTGPDLWRCLDAGWAFEPWTASILGALQAWRF